MLALAHCLSATCPTWIGTIELLAILGSSLFPAHRGIIGYDDMPGCQRYDMSRDYIACYVVAS